MGHALDSDVTVDQHEGLQEIVLLTGHRQLLQPLGYLHALRERRELELNIFLGISHIYVVRAHKKRFDLIEPPTWKKSSSMPHSRASFSFMPKSADHCNFGLVLFNGMERKASDRVSTSGQLVCSSLIWSLRGISRNPVTSRKRRKMGETFSHYKRKSCHKSGIGFGRLHPFSGHTLFPRQLPNPVKHCVDGEKFNISPGICLAQPMAATNSRS